MSEWVRFALGVFVGTGVAALASILWGANGGRWAIALAGLAILLSALAAEFAGRADPPERG